MRVVHCYRTYFPDPPGGLQEAIRQICIATTKLGVSNTVFCLSRQATPKSLMRAEGEVVRSRLIATAASCDFGGVGAFREFARLARQADILHFHFPWPFADILRIFVRTDIPQVMTYHSDIVRQGRLKIIYHPLMWKTLNGMQSVVATSPSYQRTSPILSDPSIRDRISMIPLGIDDQSYSVVDDDAIIDRLGVKNAPYFLFVGVLRYYKGLHTLVEAAKGVGARVVIAGSGPEDRYLTNLARRHGASNIIFAGQVSDAEKVALLKKCYALVLPSHLRSEAFGMVLVEAAMFGRPLISCEIGSGTSFVNLHNETGLVIRPRDAKALADAMNFLLENCKTADLFGRAARRRYEQMFSSSALGEAYVDLYQNAMVGARS